MQVDDLRAHAFTQFALVFTPTFRTSPSSAIVLRIRHADVRQTFAASHTS
jgi:hypothetical protein